MPVNTKDIISNELYNMAKVKNIDKITVKAIIEKCGISRQTFYYHFRDIMDVIEYSIKKRTEKILKESLKKENPKEVIRIFVDVGVEDYPLMKKLFESRQRPDVEKLIAGAFRSYLYEMVSKNGIKKSVSYKELEVILTFYAYGIAGLIIESCGAPDVDRETLVEQIYSIITDEISIFPERR